MTPYNKDTASTEDRIAWALCQIIDDDAPLRWTRYRFAAECIARNEKLMADLKLLAAAVCKHGIRAPHECKECANEPMPLPLTCPHSARSDCALFGAVYVSSPRKNGKTAMRSVVEQIQRSKAPPGFEGAHFGCEDDCAPD